MASYLDLQTRIAGDLSRDDLGSQIKDAIGDAIKNYERDRFYFNYTRSLTFPTVAGQVAYTGSDLPQIPNIIRIDHLFLRDTVSTFDLDRIEPDEFEWLQGNNTGPGRSNVFTYIDGQIMLWPIPAAVYTLRPHMHYRLAALAADTDSNAWTNDAEQLIRAHAKLLLYTNVIEDTDGMQRMQLQIPAYKGKLDYETSARMSTGKIHGTNF
ncbi:phage adaptor protein [Bradyrhizobium sp. USDA 4452]